MFTMVLKLKNNATTFVKRFNQCSTTKSFKVMEMLESKMRKLHVNLPLKVVLLKIHHLLLLHSQRIMKSTFMKTRMMMTYVSYCGYKKVFSTLFNVFISIWCASIHVFVWYLNFWVSSKFGSGCWWRGNVLPSWTWFEIQNFQR